MDCEEIQEVMYDYATARLDQDERKRVDDHLKDCGNCQFALDEMKETLHILDDWERAEVPSGFKDKVMTQMRKETGIGPKPWMDKFFKPFYFKLPLQGLAVAALILVALTIYRGFTPEPDRTPRDIKISTGFIEAKNPILIEVKNMDEALKQLKEMIQTHNGSLVRRKRIERGLEVTFKVEKEQEENLFGDLSKLGDVLKREQGFRDSDENIVIVLKGK